MCYCAMLLKLLQNLHIFFQWFKFKTDILKGVFLGSLGLANQGTRQFGGKINKNDLPLLALKQQQKSFVMSQRQLSLFN